MPEVQSEDDFIAPAGGLWQVRLLGALELRNGDHRIEDGFRDRSLERLFVHLAIAPRMAHPKLALARAVWPDFKGSEAELLKHLSRRISDLRKAHLEPPGFAPALAIEVSGDYVRLNAAAFDIDVERFERHVRRREWKAARETWRGELVPQLRDATVDARRDQLSARLALVDEALGRPTDWLSGDDEPEQDEAAPQATGSDPEPRGVLPFHTRFFGREEEIRQLGSLVAAHRLVVLHGPPGAGKTRTMSEAGKTVLAGFVERQRAAVEHCRSVEQVIDTVRAAFGIDPGQVGALEALATRIGGRRVLIVLDDFEHMVGAAGDAAIDSLLASLPAAHLLVTTRRALARPDAVSLPLAPLPLPEPGTSVKRALANPAVALFANRARGARSNFRVGTRNLALVVEICRHLDGMPLALELAGAICHRLTLAALRDELLRSTRVLARALHGDERHGSLDSALHLSWRLLEPDQQDLLRALAVFRGGFTLEQARALAGGERIGHRMAALARDALVVQRPEPGGVPRLALLSAVREFAEHQLGGAEAARLRRAHRELFERLAVARMRRREWPDEADGPNLMAAIANALADDEPQVAARLALALGRMWRARGAGAAELALLQSLAGHPALRARPRALLHILLALLLVNAGQEREAHVHVAHALALAGDDPLLEADALLAQAAVHWLGALDAVRTLDLVAQAQVLMDGVPAAHLPPELLARRLLLQGAAVLQAQDGHVEARRLAEQADRLYARRKDVRGALHVMPLRTMVMVKAGDPKTALHLIERSLRPAEKLGLVSVRQQLLNRQAYLLETLGRFEDTLAVLQQQVQLAQAQGAPYHLSYALWNQCLPLARLARHRDAAVMMGFSHQYWASRWSGFSPADKAYERQVRDIVVAALGEAAWRRWRARGRDLPEAEGLALGSGEATG